MEIYLNDDRVDTEKHNIKPDEFNAGELISYVESVLLEDIACAVEVDGRVYIGQELRDNYISLKGAEKVNFIADNVRAQKMIRDGIKKRLLKVKKTLRRAASEYMLGDSDRGWRLLSQSRGRLNQSMNMLRGLAEQDENLAQSEELENVKKKRRNTTENSISEHELIGMENRELAEAAEELVKVAEDIIELVSED